MTFSDMGVESSRLMASVSSSRTIASSQPYIVARHGRPTQKL